MAAKTSDDSTSLSLGSSCSIVSNSPSLPSAWYLILWSSSLVGVLADDIARVK